MLIDLIPEFADLIRDIDISCFRDEFGAFELSATIYLHDETLIHVKDYLFRNGDRKYAYQWQDRNEILIARWDNAEHWKKLTSYPHHAHFGDSPEPKSTTIQDIHGVLRYIRDNPSSTLVLT